MLDTDYRPHGRHLIAGDRVEGAKTFRATPVADEAFGVSMGTAEIVDCAARRAEEAFAELAATARDDRATFLASRELSEEVFGPLGLLVRAASEDEMIALAEGLHGQLTATLHFDDADQPFARGLLPILERTAGRLLAYGFPAGVELADAIVHSGPYPASTNFGHTSVGKLAISRFLSPVCYQNLPAALLPNELQ